MAYATKHQTQTHTHPRIRARYVLTQQRRDDDERGGRACSRVPSFTYRLTTPPTHANVCACGCARAHVCLPQNKTRPSRCMHAPSNSTYMFDDNTGCLCDGGNIDVTRSPERWGAGRMVCHCVLFDFRFHVAADVDVCSRGGYAKSTCSEKGQIHGQIDAVSRAINHHLRCAIHLKNVRCALINPKHQHGTVGLQSLQFNAQRASCGNSQCSYMLPATGSVTQLVFYFYI